MTAPRRLALWPSPTSILAAGWGQEVAPDGGITYVGVDPGQHGAVGAVRVVAPSAGQPPRVVAAVVAHAAGGGGYQRAGAGTGRRPQLEPLRARAALRQVVEAVGPAGHVLVALEALGLRPGEGVRSTSTAGVGHGVWRSVLALGVADAAWAWREVQTQQVDRVMGLPAVGRALRKSLVLSYGVEALAEATGATQAQWREALTPMGARVVSDGAGDALWMALAMARGL